MRLPSFAIGQRIENLSPAPRLAIGALLLLSGMVADYTSGPEFTVLLFYLAAVTFAAWYLGARSALVASAACALSAFLVEHPWGRGLPTDPLGYWNVLIRLLSFLFVAWLTLEKRAHFDQIRERATQDARALRAEESFSSLLQDELAVREAEQRRIGRDLHDGLSQHLTATMLASKILGEQLAEQSREEAVSASRVTGLLDEALVRVQNLSRGLYAADVVALGLRGALGRLAATTEQLSRVSCDFTTRECDVQLDEAWATHLYRIAQEALTNAVRHGKPRRITMDLVVTPAGTELSVADDGIGIAEDALASGGLGLRTMHERARAMGGSLMVTAPTEGGTRVVCRVPAARGCHPPGHRAAPDGRAREGRVGTTAVRRVESP